MLIKTTLLSRSFLHVSCQEHSSNNQSFIQMFSRCFPPKHGLMFSVFTNITHSPYCILITRVVGSSLRPVNSSASGYFWMLLSASFSQGKSRPLYPNGIPEGRQSTDCRHFAVPPAQRSRGKMGVKHDVCAGPMGPTTSG